MLLDLLKGLIPTKEVKICPHRNGDFPSRYVVHFNAAPTSCSVFTDVPAWDLIRWGVSIRLFNGTNVKLKTLKTEVE